MDKVSGEIDEGSTSYTKLVRFRDSWLKNERYAPWLQKMESGKAFCSLCKKTLVPKKSVIDYHSTSRKHLQHSRSKDEKSLDQTSELEKAIAIGKLKFAGLVVDRNLSFLSTNYIVPVFQSFARDSEILESMDISRHVVKNIICHILSPTYSTRLREILKNQKFSIIVDESTDITVKHSMCIIVRYLDLETQQITEGLWDLVELYVNKDSVANAEHVSKAIINSFEKESIPFENIVGFCSDTCNLMMGIFDSVSRKLKSRNADLLIVRCNAHIQHLSAKYAMKEIPLNIENFLSDIYKYINHGSGKRRNRWELHQSSLHLTQLAILKPASTRWLSIGDCIERILRRWPALKSFFENERGYEQTAARMLEYFEDPILKYYLKFLYITLTKFNTTISTVQSVAPVFTENSDKMEEFYKDLLCMYMDETFVRNTNIDLINPLSEAHNLPLNRLRIGNVGEEVWRENTLVLSQKIDFFQCCKKYLKTACDNLRKRIWETENDAATFRSMFHPSNAISSDYHAKHPNLNEIVEKFAPFLERVDSAVIAQQWQELPEFPIPDDIRMEENLVSFWIGIRSLGTVFLNLAELALLSMLLPNSNASAERLWSKLNLEKTKLRNKLDFKTVRAILLAAQYIKDQGGCVAFQPPEDMLSKMLAGESFDSEDDKGEDKEDHEEEENAGTSGDDDDLYRQCQLAEKLYFRSRKQKKHISSTKNKNKRTTRPNENKGASNKNSASNNDKSYDNNYDKDKNSGNKGAVDNSAGTGSTDKKSANGSKNRETGNNNENGKRKYEEGERDRDKKRCRDSSDSGQNAPTSMYNGHEILENGNKRRNLIQPNGYNISIRVANTCAFDAAAEIFVNAYKQILCFRNTIDSRITTNKFFFLVSEYARKGISEFVYSIRAAILKDIYICRNNVVDCYTNINEQLQHLILEQLPMSEEIRTCSNPNSTCMSTSQKKCYLELAAPSFHDLFSTLEERINAILIRENQICRTCKQYTCRVQLMISPAYLCLNVESYFYVRRASDTNTCSLDEIPTTLRIGSTSYVLMGAAEHDRNHYVAQCRSLDNVWVRKDDLNRTRITPGLQLAFVFYARMN